MQSNMGRRQLLFSGKWKDYSGALLRFGMEMFLVERAGIYVSFQSQWLSLMDMLNTLWPIWRDRPLFLRAVCPMFAVTYLCKALGNTRDTGSPIVTNENAVNALER